MKTISFDVLSGQYSCFSVGKPDGISQVTDKPVTWEQTRQLAHMTWTVSKRQLVHPNGSGQKIDAWGIFRDDTDQFFATVGRVYLPLQFEYAFTFCDSLIGEVGGSHYESAGILGEGNVFWVLVRCPAADFFINGTEDFNKAHVLFASSHDGSMATTARLTHINVKRNVSLQTALRYDNGDVLRIKHTTNSERKLAAAKSLMSQVVLSSQDIASKLNLLAEREMTKESMATVLDKVFPGDQSSRRDNVMLRIIDLFENNQGNVVPEVKGTAYSLLNALNSYVDHEKGVRSTCKRKGLSEDKLRAESAVFGSGNDLKEIALDVLLEETKNNPKHIIVPAA
jgi:phage/plasmid-like protein (TIGR03299 family)